MGKPELKPSYWASISGGKDSVYMLNLIFDNLDRYPLDGVVHFELEIDYPFIKNVIDDIESKCKEKSIQFMRIKPRKTWEELYYTVNSKTGNIYGFPTRVARWCNDKYKLDAQKQLKQLLKEQEYSVVFYVGYCVDEEKRYKKRNKTSEIYPLVENNVLEKDVLKWASSQAIFNHYYETQTRCGCMYCPLMSYINGAYLLKYYPDSFNYMIDKIRETEKIRELELGRPFAVMQVNPKYNADYVENVVKTKWLKKLNKKELENKKNGTFCIEK